MQYILAILFGILILSILFRKLMNKKEKQMADRNDFMYNQKEHEFFEGKNKPNNPQIDYRGRLINMDEHAEDIS